MDDKSFDDIINSKLSDFSSDNESGSWELFEESSEDLAFDDALRSSVSTFSIVQGEEVWEQFENSRVASEFDDVVRNEVSTFDNNEIPSDFEEVFETPAIGFDALIGAKLAEVTMNDAADWDSFEKILENNEHFDSKVKQKVEDFEVSGSENHWPKLSEHLEKVERRRRRIVITKFIEAAVFILFIITIMQLYPIDNIAKRSVYRTHGVAEELRINSSEDHSNATAASALESKVEETPIGFSNLLVNEDNVADVNSDKPVAEIQFLSNNLIFEIAEGSPTTKELVFVEPLYKMSVKATSFDIELQSNAGISSLNQESVLFYQPYSSLPLERVNIDRDYAAQVKPSIVLASLKIPEINIAERDFASPIVDLSSEIKRGQYWFNLYGSPQINMISTPYDISYDDSRSFKSGIDAIEAYSHMAEGYTLGASISREATNYELEGGVEYTSLNYYPRQITELVSNATSGYKEVLLREIIFDIIEIPLSIKYNFFKKKGWKIYGSNGVSLGLVAFADHDIETNNRAPLASGIKNDPVLPVSDREIQKSIQEEASFIQNKDFNEGFIKTKEFIANSYLTVNMGVGVSKEISDKMSFYIQPTYYHNLSQSGIGPNNDVHHRLALQIGTKVRL